MSNVPELLKGTVESTVIVEEPADTFSIVFVCGVIEKSPCIADSPSNPTYNSNL